MRPIQVLILDEIENRLELITEVNEYPFDLLTIDRARLTPFKSDDLPAANFWSTSDDLIEEVGGRDTRLLSVNIELHTVETDEPFVDVAYTLGAYVVTAINRAVNEPKVSDDTRPCFLGLVDKVKSTSIRPMTKEGLIFVGY